MNVCRGCTLDWQLLLEHCDRSPMSVRQHPSGQRKRNEHESAVRREKPENCHYVNKSEPI